MYWFILSASDANYHRPDCTEVKTDKKKFLDTLLADESKSLKQRLTFVPFWQKLVDRVGNRWCKFDFKTVYIVLDFSETLFSPIF